MAKRGTIDWITPAEFQALAEKSATPASIRDKALRKEIIPDELKALDPEARTIQFRITTGCRDRDRDTIAPTGWKLENYLRNPVVLWAHDYSSLPVAKALSIEARADGLASVAQFASADVYAFADTVYRMLKGGFLNATSVGFRPLAWVFDEEARGVNFSEQELLEFSIVPVPANPEALVEIRSAGIDTAPLLVWAEQKLDGWKQEDGLYVSKTQVEAVFRILSAYKVGVAIPAKVSPPEVQTPEDMKESNNAAPTSEDGAKEVIQPETHLTQAGISEAVRRELTAMLPRIREYVTQEAPSQAKEQSAAPEIPEQRSADPVLDLIAPAKEVALEIVDPGTPDPPSPEQLETAVRAVVLGAVGATIAQHVTQAINRHTGRVD